MAIDIIPGTPVLGDNVFLGFGAGKVWEMGFDTSDANANMLFLSFEGVPADDPPVFVIGDSIKGVDLGAAGLDFNAVELPTLALLDGDRDTAVGFDYSADDAPRIFTLGTTRNLTVAPTGDLILDPAGNVVSVAARVTVTPVGATGTVGLDLQWGGDGGFLFGADGGANTRTDATNKFARFNMPHFTNAEQVISLFRGVSTTSVSSLDIGGGSSALNALTEVNIFLASDNTTTGGTKRLAYTVGAWAFQEATTVSTTAGDFTVAAFASFNVTLKADDADAFTANDGTTDLYNIDTRVTTDDISVHTFDGTAVTVTSDATTSGHLVTLNAKTWNFDGGVNITTPIDGLGLQILAPVIASDSSVVLTQVSTFYVAAPDVSDSEVTATLLLAAEFDGGVLITAGRLLGAQGADVGSTNNLVLGIDGNSFEITGTTDINLISSAGWVNGSVIRLHFTSTATVKDAVATSGANTTILLDGSADFLPSAGDNIQLELNDLDGVVAWRETGGRNVL